MPDNWHKKFETVDDSKHQAAAKAFQIRLEDIQRRLGEAEKAKKELEAQVPAAQAEAEESLLTDGDADALGDLLRQIEIAERKTQVIRDTLSRERSSPELESLAQRLWDASAELRGVLLSLLPEAQQELWRAQEAYVRVVSKVGEMARRIARLESVMNKAAGPFLKEKRYQASTPPLPIIMDTDRLVLAYDPALRLTGGVNLAVLDQAKLNATTALAVLKGEAR